VIQSLSNAPFLTANTSAVRIVAPGLTSLSTLSVSIVSLA